MKGVVSRVTSEKVLNKPCVVLTQKPVDATRQEKLSTLVKAAWHYNVLFLRSRKLQTNTHVEYDFSIMDTIFPQMTPGCLYFIGRSRPGI